MSVVRNIHLGGATVDKLYLGATPIESVYLGDTLVYGGSDSDVLYASECGLEAGEGTQIYYMEGETFGDISRPVEFRDTPMYAAWGGYNTPTPYSNAVTVYHYGGLPPAVYISSPASLKSYGYSLRTGQLYFICGNSIVVEGGYYTTGNSFSWRKPWTTNFQSGALFRGPRINATLITDSTNRMYRGYQFDYAGGPIQSYLTGGSSVPVSPQDEIIMRDVWDAMMANAGKRLVF